MPLFFRAFGSKPCLETIFAQPHRSRVYHYALNPKLLAPDEELSPNEERLYKPVAPADKWEHTSSNFDPLVARFTGMIVKRGEREAAREAMRQTFREIKLIQLQKMNSTPQEEQSRMIVSPITIIHDAVKNCTPILVLNPVVRGGILYKVPAPPRTDSVATHMAIKFLIDTVRDKPADQRFWKVLARELVAASQKQGKAYRQKEQLHKQCEENRAYANYRKY